MGLAASIGGPSQPRPTRITWSDTLSGSSPQGHDVTLFTRGKKAVTYQIPDDTVVSYKKFADKINHIAGDRMVGGCMAWSQHITNL